MVTDSEESVFYEIFNFVAGTNAVNIITGTAEGGTGAESDPKIGDDIIFGFGQNDQLNGLSGDDILFGGEGTDNPLVAGAGDDQLFGGRNEDELIGGPGADILSGGQGDDTFVWLAGDLAGTTNDHFDVIIDVITDWDNGDTLDISALLADFGFDSGTDSSSDWVSVMDDGTDTIVAVATSPDDAAAANYTNLVTLQNVVTDLTTLEATLSCSLRLACQTAGRADIGGGLTASTFLAATDRYAEGLDGTVLHFLE